MNIEDLNESLAFAKKYLNKSFFGCFFKDKNFDAK